MADSFRNVRLSTRVETGAQGGPGFKTTIIETASGAEFRNIAWSRQRGRWDVGYTDDHKKIQELIAFFQVMRGRAYGFRFRDWSDYHVDNVFAVGDGATKVFQAAKVYKVGTYAHSRVLTRLVAPVDVTVVMPEPEEEEPPYVVPGHTTDIETGKITFSAALPIGATVAIKCQFDVPVRFDIDDLPVTMITQTVSRLDSVPLVERRENDNT